jgi:hypothetical protein
MLHLFGTILIVFLINLFNKYRINNIDLTYRSSKFNIDK